MYASGTICNWNLSVFPPTVAPGTTQEGAPHHQTRTLLSQQPAQHCITACMLARLAYAACCSHTLHTRRHADTHIAACDASGCCYCHLLASTHIALSYQTTHHALGLPVHSHSCGGEILSPQSRPQGQRALLPHHPCCIFSIAAPKTHQLLAAGAAGDTTPACPAASLQQHQNHNIAQNPGLSRPSLASTSCTPVTHPKTLQEKRYDEQPHQLIGTGFAAAGMQV